MTKYEYLVEAAPDFWIGRPDGGSDITAWLKAKASDGWVLVGVSHPICYFKREVREIETKKSIGEINRKMLDL